MTAKSTHMGILGNRLSMARVALAIGLLVPASIAATGRESRLSYRVSVRENPKTDSSHLHIRLERTSSHTAPSHLNILGKGPRLDLSGLTAGSRLGHLRAESSNGDQLDLEIRLVSRPGANRCDFEILAESYADRPLAKGTLENAATGFEMGIQLMDWLVTLSRNLIMPQNLAAEIDFDIPLRPNNDELSVFVSATR